MKIVCIACLLASLLSSHTTRAELLQAKIPDQTTPPAAAPLPDIPTLMREVELHQRSAEAIQKDYLYQSDMTFDKLDGNGDLKKRSSLTYEVFWLNGVEVQRLLKRDGKPLSAEELKRESEALDKRVAKARERRDKTDAQGKETDSQGHEEITVSRMLGLGTFSNARRQRLGGRDTILIDFLGNPEAKTHDVGESAMHDMAGTVWIDEQDKAIRQIEGRFQRNFKVGGGLVASIAEGTTFQVTNVRINDEVWLPGTIKAHGNARYLLFFSFNGDFALQNSGYRKFKATSTILPNSAAGEGDAESPAAAGLPTITSPSAASPK